MAECPAATSSSCTGLNTGEACGPLKPVVSGLPLLDDLVVSSDGASITIAWGTAISYPDQLVRTHVREAAAVGYPDEGFKHTARNLGTVTHANLTPETEHLLWIRIEDPTQASGWIVLKVTTTPGTDIPLDFIVHQGEFVFHVGDLVTY